MNATMAKITVNPPIRTRFIRSGDWCVICAIVLIWNHFDAFFFFLVLLKKSKQMKSPRRCSSGQIRRKSYTRKNGTYVRSTCVPDTGKPGKTPKSKRVLPKLSPGRLSKYGYSTTKPDLVRRVALANAIEAEGYGTIIKRLVVISNYNKNTLPTAHAVLRSDIKWAQTYWR